MGTAVCVDLATHASEQPSASSSNAGQWVVHGGEQLRASSSDEVQRRRQQDEAVSWQHQEEGAQTPMICEAPLAAVQSKSVKKSKRRVVWSEETKQAETDEDTEDMAAYPSSEL